MGDYVDKLKAALAKLSRPGKLFPVTEEIHLHVTAHFTADVCVYEDFSSLNFRHVSKFLTALERFLEPPKINENKDTGQSIQSKFTGIVCCFSVFFLFCMFPTELCPQFTTEFLKDIAQCLFAY